MASKRTSLNFRLSRSKKIDLDNSKKLFSAHTFLAFGFLTLTPQKKYPIFKNLGTRNLLERPKAPLFSHFTWTD